MAVGADRTKVLNRTGLTGPAVCEKFLMVHVNETLPHRPVSLAKVDSAAQAPYALYR